MSKIWREIADPEKHRDLMSIYSLGGMPVEKSRDNLIEKWVYFAEVEGFVFQMIGIEQVEQCKKYFESKVHPSTRAENNGLEHYWQSWECRLPKGIHKDKRRQKVLKRLDEILKKWSPSC